MNDIHLLIIEDEEDQITVYDDTIRNYNKKHQTSFTKNVCRTFREGEDALKSPSYDAAIIDLKLSTGEELEGRELLLSVYQKLRIPIFVYSGSISQIDDIPENALLRKRLRTERLATILQEIVEIYNTGLTTLLRPTGIIDQKLSEIFWNNLSADIEIWIKHNNQNTLLRYILLHFLEYLDINSEGNFEEYHEQEFYLAPPIKVNLHTGDLIKMKEEFFLVLTPACDIVIQSYVEQSNGLKIPVRKAENIILVKAKEFNYKESCLDKHGKLDKGKIKQFVTNNSYRFHYMPRFKKNNGFLIDFQDITSIPFSKEITFERVASISSPFIKDIISRFGSYYSRQGQPTFNQESLIEHFYQEGKK